MRRGLASAVVVAAVAAVAALALVDAVHPLRPEPASPLDAEAAERLSDLGVAGRLVYADAGCRVHALALPALTPVDAPEGEGGCELSVSPDGRHVARPAVRWSAGGKRCEQDCAWRAEEQTTVRDGAIRSGAGLLVSRDELGRALREAPFAPPGDAVGAVTVRDHVWLSRGEVAALLEAPGMQASVVAGFRDGDLAWQRAYLGRFDRLVVSAGGDVLPEPPPRPHPFLTGLLRLAGPFDWSPEGTALVVAARASVFVVDLPSGRHVRIPVTARDVAWR